MSEPIKILNNFLSPEHCQELITHYYDKVSRSVVIDTTISYTDSSRTSSSYFIPDTDEIIIELKKKTADFLKIPVENIEGIQFLRYKKGEKYNYHYDFFPENITNQRVHTILVYLNTLEESDGGATSFFHYKQKFIPKEGQGIWFKNINEDGTVNRESLHSGEEIKTDVIKYALNIWTRQHKY